MTSSSSSSNPTSRIPGQLPKSWLLALLWAIFLTEGGSRASVPFGWIRRKYQWQNATITERPILVEVARELQLEWRRHIKSGGYPSYQAFIRHLAVRGYNANPNEMDVWGRNVLSIFEDIMEL